VKVKDGKFTSEGTTNLDDVQATFHFKDPSDFVLTAFQRFPGGEASGDPKVIEEFRICSSESSHNIGDWGLGRPNP
jgi:hypothetical protein